MSVDTNSNLSIAEAYLQQTVVALNIKRNTSTWKPRDSPSCSLDDDKLHDYYTINSMKFSPPLSYSTYRVDTTPSTIFRYITVQHGTKQRKCFNLLFQKYCSYPGDVLRRKMTPGKIPTRRVQQWQQPLAEYNTLLFCWQAQTPDTNMPLGSSML